MNGIVTGGWQYVWSAYIVTIVLLGGYVLRTLAQRSVRGVTRSE